MKLLSVDDRSRDDYLEAPWRLQSSPVKMSAAMLRITKPRLMLLEFFVPSTHTIL